MARWPQISDAAPTAPEWWTLIAYVVTDEPEAIHSADLSLVVPPPVSFPMTVAIAFMDQYIGPYHAAEAAFLAGYPATTYTVTVDLGAGAVAGEFPLPRDLYCPRIPALAGDTFSRLQAYDVTLAFDVTINGFTLAPGTNTGSSTVTVIEAGQPAVAWSVGLQPGDTTFQIPAGMLLPGTDYTIGISYHDEASSADVGFGTATSRAGYYRGTGASFTTQSGV